MTLAQALRAACATLERAGVEAAVRDARLLAAMVLGTPAALLDPKLDLDPGQAARFDALVQRRALREPVARIAGVREFWGLEFAVTPATLDPRPDSETLIEAVVAERKARPPATILDLGTGTGCLLCALLREFPAAHGLGIDIAPEAVRTASANAARLDLEGRAEFAAGSWFAPVVGTFDVIVANPPYIPSGDLSALAPEVTHYDPRAALDGGPDGLAHYRAIVRALPPHLAPGGLVAFEVGAGQAQAVAQLMAGVGLRVIGTRADLAGVERCVLAAQARKTLGNQTPSG